MTSEEENQVPETLDSMSKDALPEECRSCPFGSGPRCDCTLIKESRLAELLAEGPCNIDAQVSRQVEQVIRSHYPMSAGLITDIAQDAKLRLLQMNGTFPGQKLARLPSLLRWLRHFAKNHVIDSLRKARVITKIRCGACVHFSQGSEGGCRLEQLPGDDGHPTPNPWAGHRVERKTDPRKLDPSCREFSWRRVGTFDIFEEEMTPREKTRKQRRDALATIVQALERMGARSERGLRAAVTIQRHYLRGHSVSEIAQSSSVSEKTVKRLLSSGREGLLEILRSDFEVDTIAELLG